MDHRYERSDPHLYAEVQGLRRLNEQLEHELQSLRDDKERLERELATLASSVLRATEPARL